MPYIWLEDGAASSSSGGHSGIDVRQWNALIGVVTAIVGNVLISFALNLQRYAHIRLDKEQLRRSKSWVSSKGKNASRNAGYGTQLDLANERAEINRNAPAMDEQDTEHQARYHYDDTNHFQDGDDIEDERAPLKGYKRSSISSASTLRRSKETGDDETFNQTYLKSPYWWAGICLMTVGEAGNFLAYGFAPASIVSPLGVVALISNCIIAPVLLKERFRQRDLWGVVVAVGGAVTVVLSAKHEETRMGPQDLWEAITRWEFELYLGITAGAIVGLMWASGKYGQKTILIDLGLVGLFGGYTALATKGVASLLSDTLWRAITFPITYILVFVLVATATLQIRYVNRALQHFDSTQVIPTQFVLFTLSVIIGSAVLYRDFESVTGDRLGKFIGGCALTFLGVYLITSGRSKTVFEEDEEEALGDGIGLIDDESLQDALQAKVKGGIHSLRSQDLAPPELNGANGSDNSILQMPRRQSSQQTAQRPTPYRPERRASSNVGTGSSSFEADHSHAEATWISSQENASTTPDLSRHSTHQSNAAHDVAESGTSTPRKQPPSRLGSLSREQADRVSLARRSMSRIVPGPIVTPLSSSLSGVVADALRNSPSGRSMRRRMPSLRKSRSQRVNEVAAGEGEGIPEAGPSLTRGQSEGIGRELAGTEEIDKAAEVAGAKSRSRSLSQSIGAFLHLDRTKSDGNVVRNGGGNGSGDAK